MIWATVAEVRGYLDAGDIPAGTEDSAVQRMIDRCARTLGAKVLRWPVLDEETDRAADEEQRGHIVAAVAETVKARFEAQQLAQQLGGEGLTEVIAAGGSVTAGKLSVSGGSKSGGSGGAKIGRSADRVPVEAIEALLAANLLGGGVPSW
ncbi:hypothetical protein SAMN05216188_11849 [Lentzea xinjiangensis]|uniref:Uncharacterized protein n=1 Tax=Lentzea xinjiangensis TaxID=402600 RepID=A0A1H9TEX3_9PSEU|nr:hypothetical protein [Lentzea xinjiangensis]SER95163.1 hypothetical protein SAMN05216188_11849 [Lentzea xinjiangensis]